MLTEGVSRLSRCSLGSVWHSAAVLADRGSEAVKPLGLCQGGK